MAKAKAQFPKTLYVIREDEGEDSYLSTRESIDELTDDGQIVATYTLTEVGKVSVEVTVNRTYSADK